MIWGVWFGWCWALPHKEKALPKGMCKSDGGWGGHDGRVCLTTSVLRLVLKNFTHFHQRLRRCQELSLFDGTFRSVTGYHKHDDSRTSLSRDIPERGLPKRSPVEASGISIG